jgi:succinoglycan biosynthesis protein ExoL
MKILVLLPLLGHPRDSKRIAMLQEEGAEVVVSAFEREYHKGRLPNCEINTIGKLEHGKYLNRIFTFFNSIPKVRKHVRNSDIIYCSGPDMAYLAIIASIGLKKPVVLEIGDIREIQVKKSLIGTIYRKVDYYFTNKCALLVSTSNAFINEYYKKWIDVKVDAIIIENKVDYRLEKRPRNEQNDNNPEALFSKNRPFKIGYFGLLRDLWSLEILESLAKSNEIYIEIVLAGIPMDSTKTALNNLIKYDSVSYLGEYKSPIDLPKLYNNVDMVWACYPEIREDDWNLKWARPNRFYESCFYGVPIFSRKGCQDAVEVSKFNIGMIVNETDANDVIERISKITVNDLNQWKKNMLELPQKVYLYTTESKELALKLEKIVFRELSI